MGAISSSGVAVKTVTDADLLERIFRFRVDARQPDEPLPASARELGFYRDEHDDHAMHWIALVQGEIVGSARLCVHDQFADLPHAPIYRLFGAQTALLKSPIASMNRLVVAPNARGHGVGRRLDLVRVECARAQACATVVVHFSLPVASRRRASVVPLGFSLLGEGQLAEESGGWFSGAGQAFVLRLS